MYREFSRLRLLAALALAAAPAGAESRVSSEIRGLPFTRSYPLEEIGNVPRGAELSFDAFGRIALVTDGVYSVLNDTAWVDMGDREGPRGGASMSSVQYGADGRAYYGGRGSWGIATLGDDGRLHASPLSPRDAPAWTRMTSFKDIVTTADGVYFAGWNGIVFWDASRSENRFFELPGMARIFSVGGRAYVSSHGGPLRLIDTGHGTLRELPGTGFSGVAVEFTAALDPTHVLLALRDGRLLVFDGRTASPWPAQARHTLEGKVSGLHPLVDGGVAVAITGKGLFLVSADGELISALTTPEYHRIISLATREPGVLWVAGEDAIEKVLYAGALTTFGQRLGLPVSWPIVLRWNDRIVVSSGGQLYEAVPGDAGAPSRFEVMANQPPTGAWAAAARGSQMLAGNAAGIFAAEPDGRFTRVAESTDVAQLVMVGTDLCYAIGRTEIGVLRRDGERWAECAPRIPGIGLPAVVRATRRAVWIELGSNKVARVALQGDRLKLRVFDDLPWPEVPWVNVGVVDDIVVLTGTAGERVFFDERTEERCGAPELQRLLDRSPYWITRIQNDETGTLWASHHQGIVTFTPKDGDYEMDASSFDLTNDQYPFVHVLPGNDIWLSAGRSLHHVERRRPVPAALPVKPILVSLVDARTNRELLGTTAPAALLPLPFSRNSLSFRFFAGGYAWRRAPVYEFRLNRGDPWTTLGSGSLLSFPGLGEGRYELEVRIANSGPRANGTPLAFAFLIRPPWHRTWPAYTGYGVGLALAAAGFIRWASRRTQRRHLALEQLVAERTTQWKDAMQKLNEETRTSATLAERDRLAGEIHDSIQQGLSGAILQLDSTLKLPAMSGDVRTRLNVVRNMISFTRQEVQHAVWDMESPLLEGSELGDALRKLTAFINSGGATIDVAVAGTPVSLPRATKHHLLRIAQEATTNAVRHACARRITIRLDYAPETVALAISDDGAGFRPEDVLSNRVGQFGLRGIRGRARKLEGDVAIRSTPGEGTSIRVVVPLGARLSAHAENRTI